MQHRLGRRFHLQAKQHCQACSSARCMARCKLQAEEGGVWSAVQRGTRPRAGSSLMEED